MPESKIPPLLTVRDTSYIESARLLVLRPDISVLERFRPQYIETVYIEAPKGTGFLAQAQFSLSHFNIPSPEPLPDKQLRITVSLIDISPEEVPVGSRVYEYSGLAKILHKRTKAEPGAAPNGGPTTPLDSSGITEGPPSVS